METIIISTLAAVSMFSSQLPETIETQSKDNLSTQAASTTQREAPSRSASFRRLKHQIANAPTYRRQTQSTFRALSPEGQRQKEIEAIQKADPFIEMMKRNQDGFVQIKPYTDENGNFKGYIVETPAERMRVEVRYLEPAKVDGEIIFGPANFELKFSDVEIL